jgi:hypothetical protein
MSRYKRGQLFLAALSFFGLFSVSTAQVIEGDVTLSSQAEVEAFAGSFVTGNLTIQGSDIIDLTTLMTLDSVGGDLWVEDNDSLSNLNGLSNITSVGGLIIASNYSLTNLDGLSNLSSLEGVCG